MSCVRANWKKKTTKTKTTTTTKTEREKEFWTQILDSLHWPGIEPGPPAWQARILPLNHQCLSMVFHLYEQKKLPNISSVSVAVAFCFCSSITREKARRAKLNRALKKVLNINVW